MISLIRRLLGKHKKQGGGFVEYQCNPTPLYVKQYPLFERLPRKPFEESQQVTMVKTARNTWEPMMVDWGKGKEKRG